MPEVKTVEILNSDNKKAGVAVFSETHEGVQLEYDFKGLPEGEFAMHIHETGKATAPDFTDADSHWNPTNVEHGKDSDSGPHVGDLPNIIVDESGEVSGREILQLATLEEDAPQGKYSLYNEGRGTSLIVHTGADDYRSQPTGDAGGRQLGGVIIPAE